MSKPSVPQANSVTKKVTTDKAQEKIKKLTEEIGILNDIIQSQEAALKAVSKLLQHNIAAKSELQQEKDTMCDTVDDLEEGLTKIQEDCLKAEEELKVVKFKKQILEKQLEEELEKGREVRKQLGLPHGATEQLVQARIQELNAASSLLKELMVKLNLPPDSGPEFVMQEVEKSHLFKNEFGELKKLLQHKHEIGPVDMHRRIKELVYYEKNEACLKLDLEKSNKLITSLREQVQRHIKKYKDLHEIFGTLQTKQANKIMESYQKKKMAAEQKIKPKKKQHSTSPAASKLPSRGADVFLQMQHKVQKLEQENQSLKMENERLKILRHTKRQISQLPMTYM